MFSPEFQVLISYLKYITSLIILKKKKSCTGASSYCSLCAFSCPTNITSMTKTKENVHI